jgi:hypothetical protein
VLSDCFLDDCANPWPGTRHFTNDDDHVRRETGDEWRNPATEVLCHLLEGFDCLRVALLGESQKMFESDRRFGSFSNAFATSRGRDRPGVIANGG